MESRARPARSAYQAFEEEAFLIGAAKIALAHSRNDTAETVLINLLRGSGMTGLTGIPAVRRQIIRPLIATGRAEILDYVAGENLAFAVDSSNLRSEYLRNRVRSSIIRELEAVNPSIIDALSRTAEIPRHTRRL